MDDLGSLNPAVNIRAESLHALEERLGVLDHRNDSDYISRGELIAQRRRQDEEARLMRARRDREDQEFMEKIRTYSQEASRLQREIDRRKRRAPVDGETVNRLRVGTASRPVSPLPREVNRRKRRLSVDEEVAHSPYVRTAFKPIPPPAHRMSSRKRRLPMHKEVIDNPYAHTVFTPGWNWRLPAKGKVANTLFVNTASDPVSPPTPRIKLEEEVARQRMGSHEHERRLAANGRAVIRPCGSKVDALDPPVNVNVCEAKPRARTSLFPSEPVSTPSGGYVQDDIVYSDERGAQGDTD